MKITYNNFFINYCNRQISNVIRPRIFNLSNLKIPKQSLYHYIPATYDDVAPTNDSFILKDEKQKTPMYSYVDLTTKYGNLNLRSYNHKAKIKEHIVNNNKLIYCSDLSNIKPNPIVPLVVNYGFCDKKYKYLGDRDRIPYYYNYNLINTIIKGINDSYNFFKSYYNQFIFINIPQLEDLPKVSEMKRSCSIINLDFFKTFNSLEKIFILELWKFLGNRREKSVFNNINRVALDQINIVLIYNKTFTVFNLGKLEYWRKSEENPDGKIDPFFMSKKFMQALILLNNSNKDEGLIELTEDEQQLKHNESDQDFLNDISKDDENENDIDNENEEVDVLDEEEKINKEYDDFDDKYGVTNSTIIDEEDILDEEDGENTEEINNSKILNIKEEDEERYSETNTEDEMSMNDILNINSIPIEEIPVLINRNKYQLTPEDKARKALEEISRDQNMTVSKYKGILNNINKYKSIKINKDSEKTLDDLIDIKKEELEIKDEDREISTLQVMDRRYINDILERDILSSLTSIQGIGAIIHDIKKNEHENILGGYYTYTLKVKPIEGQLSTIHIKVPKIKDNGRFTASGNTYFFKKQRRDLPIRKVNKSTVALTSYFGKTFVHRDESRLFNYEKWLINKIRLGSLDNNNKIIKETRTGNVFDNLVKSPNIHSLLSSNFRSITTNDAFIYLDYKKANDRFGKDLVRSVESKGLFFIGTYKGKYGLGVDDDNVFYYIGDEVTEIGMIEDICDINMSEAPIESVSVDIMSKSVPIVIALGYKLGISKLLAALKPKHYRTVKSGSRVKLEKHEYVIKFSDFNLILSKKDRLCTIIMSGFLKIKETSKYSIYLLDRKDIYFNLLESIKIPGRYVKEIDLCYRMFVDPITERILIEMNEPTDYIGLLVRSAELLLTRYHPDEVDMSEQRIAGYDRVAGEVYNQLVKALREHNRHGIKDNYPIEMNPEAVWGSLLKDTSKQMEECLNPIQDLKQQEIVTFGGNGGRSRQSMVKHTREHHINSVGIISEGTVDSADAGNTTYLSANPMFSNLYGVPNNANTNDVNKDIKPENVLSTNSVMQPCIDMDDSKRLLTSSVQISHSLSSSNSHVMPLRTGYDSKLVERCNDEFAAVAEKEGVVTSVNDYAIVVTYNDGTTRQVEIGRKYGKSGGFMTSHDIITKLKPGDKLNKGDVIAYNEDFFTDDPYNPGKLAMKTGKLVRVALIEHPYTYEDSCAINRKIARETSVKTTIEKKVVVNFNQTIHNLAKPGTKVKIDDPICFIEDAITSDSKLFDDNSINLLRNISQQSPRSPVNGVVDKVEILYNGDKEDMSDSLLKLANISDNKISSLNKALGKKPMTGEIDGSYRIDGNPMLPDTAVIIFTISSEQSITVGDKLVLGCQLKNTIGFIYDESPRLMSDDGGFGEDIDMLFGSNSVYNRIVNSPFLTGATNTLLIEVSKQIANEYLDSIE